MIKLILILAYLIFLFEYVRMGHRVICAESDARINFENRTRTFSAAFGSTHDWNEAMDAQEFYWYRGRRWTKN